MSSTPLHSADIRRQLAQLQRSLLQAAQARDWPQLRQIDRQLLALVQQLALEGIKPQFAAELAVLQQNYQQVLTLAKHELSHTEARMQQFNQNKSGVVAYRQTEEGRQP